MNHHNISWKTEQTYDEMNKILNGEGYLVSYNCPLIDRIADESVEPYITKHPAENNI